MPRAASAADWASWMVTGWSGWRGSKPWHLYAPATHILPLDIGSEPPRGRTNRSGDSDSSVLPPYFVRRHFKVPAVG